ncbi:MAG: hypothetical protein RSG95_01685 [Bacilli bacterium]
MEEDNMEEEVDFITLEDGIDYIIIDEIMVGNTKYVYLVNENDDLDFVIRKVKIENNEDYLVGLETDEEFDYALKEFTEKHKNDLE